MAKLVEIDERDLNRLLEALRYVIQRTTDATMKEFLAQELREVEAHLNNEYQGAEIVGEISAVLDYIGGRHEPDTEPKTETARSRRKRKPRFIEGSSEEIQAAFREGAGIPEED